VGGPPQGSEKKWKKAHLIGGDLARWFKKGERVVQPSPVMPWFRGTLGREKTSKPWGTAKKKPLRALMPGGSTRRQKKTHLDIIRERKRQWKRKRNPEKWARKEKERSTAGLETKGLGGAPCCPVSTRQGGKNLEKLAGRNQVPTDRWMWVAVGSRPWDGCNITLVDCGKNGVNKRAHLSPTVVETPTRSDGQRTFEKHYNPAMGHLQSRQTKTVQENKETGGEYSWVVNPGEGTLEKQKRIRETRRSTNSALHKPRP